MQRKGALLVLVYMHNFIYLQWLEERLPNSSMIVQLCEGIVQLYGEIVQLRGETAQPTSKWRE